MEGGEGGGVSEKVKDVPVVIIDTISSSPPTPTTQLSHHHWISKLMLAAASSARGPLVRSQLRHRLATTSPAFFSSAAADKNIKSVAVLGSTPRSRRCLCILTVTRRWYHRTLSRLVPV